MAASDSSTGRLRSRVRQQEVVAELSTLGLECDDVDQLLDAATDAVRETLDVDYAGAFELRARDEFVLRQGAGWRDGTVGSTTVSAGPNGQPGYALVSEEAVIVDDVETDSRFSGSPVVAEHGARSGISVTIGSPEDPWGVLGVYTTAQRDVSDADVSFVTGVANVLASSIDNIRTRRTLREEEALKDRIVETSPVGIIVADADGTMKLANERAEEITGRDRSEIARMTHGDDAWDLVDPDGEPLASHQLPFNRVLETGDGVFDAEFGIRRPDGERVWIAENATAMRDDGELTGVVSAFEDVTEEYRYRRERRRVYRALESASEGISLLDEDGRFTYVNQAYAELYGYEPDELLGEHWDHLYPDGETEVVYEEAFPELAETGVWSGETIGLRRNGTQFVEDHSLATARDGGYVCVVRDITEQRRLENELESTFDRITDAFVGLDTNWRVTYVNDRARELIDPENEGLVGEHVWEQFPSTVGSAFEREFRLAMATQEPTSFEEYFPPGATWLDVHAYPSETGLSVYFRDVGERKEMERELHENNRTLQQLYSITADRELTFNDKVDRLLELGRERLGLEIGFVADVDASDERFEVVHAIGDDDRLYPGATTPLSETYCRRTIESDELLVLTNTPAEGWDDDVAYEKWDFDSYLGGQIRVDGALYGTLCFADDESRSRSFTPAERSFVELSTQWLSYELERQRHQRALAESERRYRTLVEHFPNGLVALFDEDLRYTLVGGQVFDESDVSADEYVGETIYDRYDGETLSSFESNFEDSLAGERNRFEFELHDHEWLAYALPVTDDRGEVFAGMVMVQDVTDRKERERKLREREARLERFKAYTDDVLNAIDDIFYVIDEDGSFRRWNETLCDVSGYSEDEIESMSPLEFFATDDQERVADAIAEVFDTGHARIEADAVTKDGETIPYEFVATTLEDPEGNPVVTGIGRDITELRENQRRLENLVGELEESNERLEQFAYAASHDLQEPLRMVASYLTLLERRYEDVLDEDAEEFIGFAVDGARRMQEMIDGLLAYSRVDTQGDPFEVVELEAVVEDALTDLEIRIEETDAEITVHSLPRVYGDPGQLRQVFQNLLDNALTYAGEQAPRISVFAEKGGDEWRISVRDRGIGIDPSETERIFQVFDRLHSIDTYEGTGIGLALCQRIVERHDGDIRVDSTPGDGSTFTVTLSAPPETNETTGSAPNPSNE